MLSLTKPGAMNRGMIKLVDSNGLTRRLLVRKKLGSPPVISFPDFTKYVCRVFELETEAKVRVQYGRDGEMIVVEDELEWEETCFNLSEGETLAVVIQVLKVEGFNTEGGGEGIRKYWQQISSNSLPTPHQSEESVPLLGMHHQCDEHHQIDDPVAIRTHEVGMHHQSHDHHRRDYSVAGPVAKNEEGAIRHESDDHHQSDSPVSLRTHEVGLHSQSNGHHHVDCPVPVRVQKEEVELLRQND